MKKAFRFFIILLTCLLPGVEVDIFIPSFPELQALFDLTPAMVQLTISLNFIAYCICCLFVGPLSDRFNRRHIMLASLGLFVVGSVLCLSAQSFAFLLFGRILQGIGMAGPAVLSMLIVLEACKPSQKAGAMAIYNGLVTVAMAIAPIVGSFVSLYFGWRGNFWVLFLLGLVAFLGGYFVFPHRKGNPAGMLSLKAYIPLLRSHDVLIFIFCICLISSTFWLFIAMAPILYMGDLGIPLSRFGFFQGSICGLFALVSIASGMIIKRWGHRLPLVVGGVLCAVSTVLFLILALANVHNPWLLTFVMLIFSVGTVFPVSILYPLSLEILPHSSGRAAALTSFFRLLMTAFAVQGVSILYDRTFFYIGITMFIAMSVALYLVFRAMQIKDIDQLDHHESA